MNTAPSRTRPRESDALAAAKACPDSENVPYTATCLAFLKGSAGSEMLWRPNAPERALAEQPSEPRAVELSSVAPRTGCADTDAVPYSKGCIAFMTGWFWQPNGP
jgi:hypothetical protein